MNCKQSLIINRNKIIDFFINSDKEYDHFNNIFVYKAKIGKYYLINISFYDDHINSCFFRKNEDISDFVDKTIGMVK